MKITSELVKGNNPCSDGYIWFLENFPNGSTYKEIMEKIPSKWRDWAKEHFPMKEEYDDYLFKIDIGYGFENVVFAFDDRIRFVNKNNGTSIDISLEGIQGLIEFIDRIKIIQDLDWQANTYITHTIVTTCDDKGSYNGYILLVWQAQCGGTLHIKHQRDQYDEYNTGAHINLNSDKFKEALKNIVIRKEKINDLYR